MSNEDACKSLVTQNMITRDLHQTSKMHMITKDNNMDEQNNKRGHTNITKYANTQDAKQGLGPNARPNTKQGKA